MEVTSTQACFVCLESTGARLKVCECSTVVHAACMRKLVEQVPAHRERCAVCKAPYTCVSWRRRPRCVVLPGCVIFVVLHVIVWVTGGCYVWFSVFGDRGWYTVVMALMLAASVATLCFLHYLHNVQVGACCCTYVDCTTTVPELRV
jgi:hypothetical protein